MKAYTRHDISNGCFIAAVLISSPSRMSELTTLMIFLLGTLQVKNSGQNTQGDLHSLPLVEPTSSPIKGKLQRWKWLRETLSDSRLG